MASNTVINTNLMALTAHRNLATVGNKQQKANQRLSSGKKINSAADDAAGLAISEKMRAQIKGLDMAAKNSEDAISLIQTAEGSLSEINSMVQRIRELVVQAANGTNVSDDKKKINEEINTLLDEINSMSARTEFNTKKLTNGSFADGYFQVGANGAQKINLTIATMNATALSLGATFRSAITSAASATTGNATAGTIYGAQLVRLDSALSRISSQRSTLGATQNRLEHTVNNLNTSSENLSAAKSRIEDTDMAKEMMNLTSANVLQQAAVSMLAQANQAPNSITQLLG